MIHIHNKTVPRKAGGTVKGGKANQYGEHRIIEGSKSGQYRESRQGSSTSLSEKGAG